jgi:tetratricopeptide (TPR) repeat protein
VPRALRAGGLVWISALQNWSGLEFDQGNYALATELLQRALAATLDHPESGNRPTILLGLGEAALALGDPALAIEHCREALRVARELGVVGKTAASLGVLAAATAEVGKVDRASVLWGAAEALSAEYIWRSSDRADLERRLPELNQALVQRGRALREDEAVAFALALD